MLLPEYRKGYVTFTHTYIHMYITTRSLHPFQHIRHRVYSCICMYVYTKKIHLRCDDIGCTTASHRVCARFSFCVDGISIVVYFAAVKVVRAKGSNFPFVRHITCCCSSPIISFFLLYPCTRACVRFSLLCCFCSAYSIVAPFPLAEYFICVCVCLH